MDMKYKMFSNAVFLIGNKLQLIFYDLVMILIYFYLLYDLLVIMYDGKVSEYGYIPCVNNVIF